MNAIYPIYEMEASGTRKKRRGGGGDSKGLNTHNKRTKEEGTETRERGKRRKRESPTRRTAQNTNTNASFVTRNKAVTAAVNGPVFTFRLLTVREPGRGSATAIGAGEGSGRGNEWA